MQLVRFRVAGRNHALGSVCAKIGPPCRRCTQEPQTRESSFVAFPHGALTSIPCPEEADAAVKEMEEAAADALHERRVLLDIRFHKKGRP